MRKASSSSYLLNTERAVAVACKLIDKSIELVNKFNNCYGGKAIVKGILNIGRIGISMVSLVLIIVIHSMNTNVCKILNL